MIFCQNVLRFNPEWISAIATSVAVLFGFYEYYFRRRPYLKMEVDIQERKGVFFFIGRIVNFGNTPAYFWLDKEKIEIKIGDEIYFSEKDTNGYAFPNEQQPPFIELGKVYELGKNKLIKGEYKDNTAHLDVLLNYQSYRLKWKTYKFHLKYGIKFSDGSNGEPRALVFILSQEFI